MSVDPQDLPEVSQEDAEKLVDEPVPEPESDGYGQPQDEQG
jgi:hypothetical protein